MPKENDEPAQAATSAEVILVEDAKDPRTYFSFVPSGKVADDRIRLDSLVFVRSLAANRWLRPDDERTYSSHGATIADL